MLLEKPDTVNAAEAERLFRSPLLRQPHAPVLLEAMHFRFQASWQYFLSLVDRQNIQTVDSFAALPSYIIPKGNAQLEYNLGGGTMLHLGTYPTYARVRSWVKSLRDVSPEKLKAFFVQEISAMNLLRQAFVFRVDKLEMLQ